MLPIFLFSFLFKSFSFFHFFFFSRVLFFLFFIHFLFCSCPLCFRVLPTRRHVIICGSANQRPIVEFMQELFHPDHRNPTLQVIILTRGPPSRAVLRLLNSVKFRARTTYLDGDVVATKDLVRAAAESAEHFFIVADPMSLNPEREDSHNTLRALAIKQYVYSRRRKKATISIQMLRHESRGTYFDSVKVADCARADVNYDSESVGE